MSETMASYIDHTLLKPEATEEQVLMLCAEARKDNFYSVCINSSYVSVAAKALKGSAVKVCAVVGFPLGAATTATKAFEAREAVENGVNGFVLNKGDTEGFGKAIKKLISSKNLRDNMGARGRQKVVDHFNIGRFIENTEEVFDLL